MYLEKSANSIDFFYEKCAGHGLKITPQRKAIYEELVKSKEHPTADDLFKKTRETFPNISFDTIYRTLMLFSEIGIVSLVEGYGENKRFEPNLLRHHHFRCIKCHAIVDFENKTYDEISIPAHVRKYGNVTNKRVVLEGICLKCSGR